jgi:6-phosphogluconolactonase
VGLLVNGEVRVVDDVPGAFCDAVADAWGRRSGRGFTVALSGGETARQCYERLADWPGSPVDWMATEVYWGDERCVPVDHPDSNYRLAREALFSKVGGVHALFPMRCEDGDDAYQLLLSSLGTIDVVHLGLGPDGHTASLFPGSPALDADPGRLVVRNEDPTGNNPHPRMTLTFAGIERAALAVVTVAGASKREAFTAIRDGADLPGARIQAERVVWLVDHAAAGE